jgi:hypothetical protein
MLAPLAIGARVLFPWSLKDHPCPSSILSRYILSWQGQDIFSMLVNFRGRHVVLLSIVSSTWFAIKTHVNVIIVPAIEARPVAKMLVCHSVLIRPSSTYVPVTCCLCPTYEVLMAKIPLECPTRAVRWCEHAADAAHPLASVHRRSWRVIFPLTASKR